jgi:hypothetical protein
MEALIAELTLAQKIGQITLVSAGLAVTGPREPVDYVDGARSPSA